MANRAQRRRTKKNLDDDFKQSTKSIIITIVVVLGVFLLFFLFTKKITEKKLKTVEKEKAEASIQYNEILGDNTFTMFPHEYYVLFYDFEGAEAVYLNYLYSSYASQDNQYIYKVDLGNKLNEKFVSEETNSKASKASELKVKETTLIKIRDGKNVSYTEGSAQVIAEALK